MEMNSAENVTQTEKITFGYAFTLKLTATSKESASILIYE